MKKFIKLSLAVVLVAVSLAIEVVTPIMEMIMGMMRFIKNLKLLKSY